MWDRLLALTGTVLLCLLENWLAKPFLSIAIDDFYIIPHSFSYSVLPRIAWGLMFELTPHLGDLYCLLRDATRHGVATPDVVGPYLARDPVTDSAWHIPMGGLCWLIRGLNWTWDIGSRMADVAPVTAAMIGAMAECLDRMEYL